MSVTLFRISILSASLRHHITNHQDIAVVDMVADMVAEMEVKLLPMVGALHTHPALLLLLRFHPQQLHLLQPLHGQWAAQKAWLLREGCPEQKLPKYRHCRNGGGLTLAWIFVKDLSTCTEGPQR